MKKNVLILGAGPAGLTASYELIKHQDFNVTIIDMDSKVGGLSKTVNFNDYYFDMGGHRFFSKIKEINNIWNETLKEDFIKRPRLSRIYYNNKFYNYPLKPINAFLNLGPFESFLILLSYLYSKIVPYKKEDTFEEWVSNRFGKRLYKTFFKTYTEKVWGVPCNKIRAEWAAQRIKGLSLTKAIINAFPFKKNKNTIKTLIDEFMYPKYGPGMMYEQIAKNIEKNGGKILFNHRIKSLERKENKWLIEVNNKKITADYIISSIPLTELIQINKDSPKNIIELSKTLAYRDFLIVCLVFDKPTLLKDTWIYIHDKRIKLGRLQVLKNWSPYMLKDPNHSSYGAEYFCTEGDEIWTMKDTELIKLAEEEIKKVKLIPQNYNLLQGNVIRYKKTYAVYNSNYKQNIDLIKNYVESLPNLQVIGRYGMFKYNNMDHSMYTGLLAAKNIINGKKIYDIWKINQDEEYHEEEKDNKYEVYEINPPLKGYGEKLNN